MKRISFLFFLSLLFLTSCQNNETIVSNIDERDANEILVYLASKGIDAMKVLAPASDIGGTTSVSYFIVVDEEQSIEAMALLNSAGLPRRMGTNLLTLFAKSGLMSSDREETIRYQAGLAEELCNTIRKIDGVLDADVQISFPPDTLTPVPGAPPPKTTAAVYIKHQGIFEDPNSHLEVKIKRLLSASVNNLDYDNVSVITDRARFADIHIGQDPEWIGKANTQTYVSLWGMILSKSSLLRFRFIFFTLLILLLGLFGMTGYLLYKSYPNLRRSLDRFSRKKNSEESP